MVAHAAQAKVAVAAAKPQNGTLWKFLVPVAIGLVLWFVPPPAGLPPKAWHMFAIFVATITGIITAPLPMSAVAIIGATAGALSGVITFDDVVKSTGTDLVWLVLLAFFISKGVIKTGLGRRIALLFMRLLGKRTLGLGYGLAITELVVAPAMPSITARAGGVLLPITRAIAEVLGSRPEDETRTKVGNYLILCAFHANIITAGMFVTAMAGNPLARQAGSGPGREHQLDGLGHRGARSRTPVPCTRPGGALVDRAAADPRDPGCDRARAARARCHGPDLGQGDRDGAASSSGCSCCGCSAKTSTWEPRSRRRSASR